MTTSPREYNSLIHQLSDPNEFASFFRIPTDETIYDIDLNTRVIHVPDFISVAEDHNSEIIWFKTDRFFDNFDLYSTTCWIQYINAEGEKYFYAAPILVGVEEFGNEKILIPWAISKEVTKTSGSIEFAFQFFKLSEDGLNFYFVLNTLPAKSRVLSGLRVDPSAFLTDNSLTEEDALPQREWLAGELERLTDAYTRLNNTYELYWVEVK